MTKRRPQLLLLSVDILKPTDCRYCNYLTY